MLNRRKLLVWLAAFVLVIVAYLVYNRLVVTPPIRIQPDQPDATGLDVPELDTESARIGEAVVGTVEKSEYIVLDENKNVEQVFGFTTLLNPDAGTDEWKLQEPYMKIYEQAVRYEIVSDRGTCRVETVAGNPSPVNAHLIDNVKIHILPMSANGPPTSTIHLDDLFYDSERSEFKTDGPIKIISQDGRMEGEGMLLIYNNALGRVEYLKIKDLDYLHLKDISVVSSKASAKSPQTSPASGVAKLGPVMSPPESRLSEQSDETPVIESDKALVPPADDVPSGTSEEVQSRQDDYYVCRFERDVVITYGARIMAKGADEVTISNILLSGWPTNESSALTEQNSVRPDGAPDAETVTEPAGPADDDAEDVYVTCKGGITIQPVTSILSATDETIQSTGGLAPTPAAARESERPARFSAKKIDYDMETDYAFATGPVMFTFYAGNPDYKDADPVPVVITANDNAEFFGDQNRVVFNGSIVGLRRTQTSAYLQVNTFRGQKLIVDLVQAQPNSTDVRHVTVVGGKVRLESVRSVDDVTINHVRLSCRRIDYEASDEIVTATGPGDIQINNENAPPPDKEKADKKISLQRPCYGFIEGFDKLRWFTTDNRITADGKTKSVNMNYLPLVEGKWGQVVHSAATHIEANFTEAASGRSELAKLRTTGGVFYREVGGNEFVGDTLFYDAAKSLMTVAGTDQVPCLLNGALVDGIEYDLATGKAKGRLASKPGTLRRPPRKRWKIF